MTSTLPAKATQLGEGELRAAVETQGHSACEHQFGGDGLWHLVEEQGIWESQKCKVAPSCVSGGVLCGYIYVCVCVSVLGMSVCTHVQSLSQSCELFYAVFGPSAQPTATQS